MVLRGYRRQTDIIGEPGTVRAPRTDAAWAAMFRSQSRPASDATRFSLLLVDEGEYYFDDYAAVRHTVATFAGEAEHSEQPGRLRVCSHSVVFEPEDEAAPLVKIKFVSCELREHKEHAEWDGSAELAEPEEEQEPAPTPSDEEDDYEQPPPVGGADPPAIDDAEFDEDAPELDPAAAADDDDEGKGKGKRRGSLEGMPGVEGLKMGRKGMGKGMKGMGSMGKGLKGGMGKGLGAGLGAVTSGLDGVKSVAEKTSDLAEKGVQGTKDGAITAKTKAAGATGLDQGLDGLKGNITDAGGGLVGGAKDSAIAGLKGLKAAKDAALQVTQGHPRNPHHNAIGQGNLRPIGCATWLQAADVAASAAGQAADLTGVTAVASKTGMTAAIQASTDAVSSAKSGVAGALGLMSGVTGLSDMATAAGDMATDGFGSVTEAVDKGVTDRAKGVTSGGFGLGGLSDMAKGALGSVTDAVGGVSDAVGGGITSLASDLGVRLMEVVKDTRPTVAITFVCANAVTMKPHGIDQPYLLRTNIET